MDVPFYFYATQEPSRTILNYLGIILNDNQPFIHVKNDTLQAEALDSIDTTIQEQFLIFTKMIEALNKVEEPLDSIMIKGLNLVSNGQSSDNSPKLRRSSQNNKKNLGNVFSLDLNKFKTKNQNLSVSSEKVDFIFNCVKEKIKERSANESFEIFHRESLSAAFKLHTNLYIKPRIENIKEISKMRDESSDEISHEKTLVIKELKTETIDKIISFSINQIKKKEKQKILLSHKPDQKSLKQYKLDDPKLKNILIQELVIRRMKEIHFEILANDIERQQNYVEIKEQIDLPNGIEIRKNDLNHGDSIIDQLDDFRKIVKILLNHITIPKLSLEILSLYDDVLKREIDKDINCAVIYKKFFEVLESKRDQNPDSDLAKLSNQIILFYSTFNQQIPNIPVSLIYPVLHELKMQDLKKSRERKILIEFSKRNILFTTIVSTRSTLNDEFKLHIENKLICSKEDMSEWSSSILFKAIPKNDELKNKVLLEVINPLKEFGLNAKLV